MSRMEVSLVYINVRKWRVQIGEHTFVIHVTGTDLEEESWIASTNPLTLPGAGHTTDGHSTAHDALWSAIGLCWEQVENAADNETILGARS